MQITFSLRSLALIFVVHALGTFAQTADKVKVKVRQSTDKDAAVKNLAAWDVIASSPNTVLVYRRLSGTTMIASVSRLDAYSMDKLTFLGSQETVSKADGQDLLTEGLVYFAGKPRVIGSMRDPKNGLVSIYSTIVDPALAKPAETPVKLCDLEGLKVKGAGSMWLQGSHAYAQFKVRVSADSSHMALVSPPLRDQSGMAQYGVVVFDRQLKPVWQGAVDVDAKASDSWLGSLLVDNGGTVHLAMMSSVPDPDAKRGMQKNELKLLSASASGVAEVKVPLDPGQSVFRASLDALVDGTTLLTATYGTKFNAIEGFLCGPIGKDSGSEQLKRYPIKEEGGTRSFDLVGVKTRTDGGFYVVSEVARNIEYDTYSRSIYSDVLVFSIDRSGKQEWTNLFRSLSAYDNPSIGARRPLVYNDQLFLFMVDTEKLVEKRKSGKELTKGDMNDPYSVYVSFDRSTGAPKAKTILKSEKDVDFISDDLEPLGNGRYFTLTLDGLMGGRFNPATIEFGMEATK